MQNTEPATSAEDIPALTTEAESALANKDWQAAANAYERLVASQPKNSDHRFNLVRAYDELGEADKALKALQHPAIAQLDKTKRRLARTYIDLKDYAAAIPLVDELIAAHPNNPKFAKWKAVLDEKSGPDQLAAERMQRGQQLFDSGRLEEAEKLFLQLLIDYPGFARANLYLGKIHSQQKRWAEAIPALRAGLATEPNNRKLKNTLARALFKNGELRSAIVVLERAEGSGKDIDSLFLLQRCHFELRNWLTAQDSGERLLVILPSDDPLRLRVQALNDEAAVRNELASVAALANPGDPDRTIGDYRKVAERHPRSPLPWLALGSALSDAERHKEAAAALRDARAAHPENLDIRTALTRAVIHSADEGTVLRHVQAAAADHGGDFESFRWLARYHAAREDWCETIEPARRALEFEPRIGAARVALVNALLHLGRLPEALEELDPLLESGEKRAEALQLKGDILSRLARLGDAVGAYQEAAALAPKDPALTRSLAAALLLNGDLEGFHRWHERRREREGLPNGAAFDEWDGELSIDGKLLVWANATDSLGDQILHLRFLRQLVALGFDVVAELDDRLLDICRRSFPQVTADRAGAVLPDGISRQTALTGLFRWFKPDLQSLASEQPYLAPGVEPVAANRARLKAAAGESKLLVGIGWPSDDLGRAIASADLAVIDLQEQGQTGQTLAALVAAMDLVLCGDDAVAHLAGAMGIPAITLLPSLPSPYWLASSERCIWYPSTRLLRQAPVDEGWTAVLEQTAAAVEQFASSGYSKQWLSNSLVPELRPFVDRAQEFSPADVADAVRCFVAQGPQHYPAYRSALQLIDRLPNDQLSRELKIQKADLLVRFGEWGPARDLLLSLRPGSGTDAEIEQFILSVSLAIYDLDHALPIARSLTAEEPAYRIIAANILYRMGRDEEALAELRTASLGSPEFDGLSTLFGTLLLETGQSRRAAAYLTDQAAVTRSTADYALLGRALSCVGKPDEAIAAYDKAIALSPEDPVANFWRTRERVASGAVQQCSLPPLEGEMPQVSPEDLVILFVANSSYFWEHALVLLGSIGRQSAGAKCHVHIVNPDTGIAPAIDQVRKALPGLSYSHESVDLTGRSEAHVRTYYASVRFVRLAEIFARAPAFYLCIDSDCIIRGNVVAKASSLDIRDVGIRMRYSDRPHMTVAAGALMLRPTPAAAKFIDRVAELISLVLESGEAAWFLDQVVLSHALREARTRDVDVTQLDMDWIDWFFRDDSLIWTGKGPRKSDACYMRELVRYRYLQQDESIRALTPPGSD